MLRELISGGFLIVSTHSLHEVYGIFKKRPIYIKQICNVHRKLLQCSRKVIKVILTGQVLQQVRKIFIFSFFFSFSSSLALLYRYK